MFSPLLALLRKVFIIGDLPVDFAAKTGEFDVIVLKAFFLNELATEGV